MAIDPRFRALFETFFEEAAEGLTDAESALLELQPGQEDDELVNMLFRAIHSIKGGGGTFGFTHLGRLSHVMETLLDQVRSGQRHLHAESQDLLLESVDCLRCILIAHKEEDAVDTDRCERLSGLIQEILDGKSGEGVSQEAAIAMVEQEFTVNSAAVQEWSIIFRPHRELMKGGNDPFRLIRLLTELGELQVTCETVEVPDFDTYDPEECFLSWQMVLSGSVSKDDVLDIFSWVDDECDLVIEPVKLQAPNVEVAPIPQSPIGIEEAMVVGKEKEVVNKKVPSKRSSQMASSSIRVSIDKIDDLVNLVGELVITQSMLDQIERDHELESVQELRDGLAELERNTRELQETVMRIRMLPIGTTFARFPRLVHDLSRKLGKHIDLQLSGEATELDKTVLENIGDPLVHLIRNSLDHGIETPEVRTAAGKDPMGTVSLSATQQGGNIVIAVRDDGAGVNREKLLAKAIEKGIVEPGLELSDQQILQILFHPGLSTAEMVSDVSGRGVGMDVVKRNIERLGGTISVDSTPGKGSVFTIRIPLTLAIIDGQVLRIGDEVYIVPLISIVESIQAQDHLVTRIAGRSEVYRFRDEALPLIRLSDTFEVPPSDKESDGMIVVVEGDDRKFACYVDELLGIQQVVIKSLDTNYQRVPGLSGATILGDGTVALIIDMTGLIRLAQRQSNHRERGLGRASSAA